MIKSNVSSKHRRYLYRVVDLYHRDYGESSRNFLIKGLCDLFGEDAETVTHDMDALMETVETYRPESSAMLFFLTAFKTDPNLIRGGQAGIIYMGADQARHQIVNCLVWK